MDVYVALHLRVSQDNGHNTKKKLFSCVSVSSLDDYINNITEKVQNGIPFSMFYDFLFQKNNETCSSSSSSGSNDSRISSSSSISSCSNTIPPFLYYIAAPQSPGFPKKEPPFLSFPGTMCRKWKLVSFVNHIRDIFEVFSTKTFFTGWGCLSHTQLLTWTTRVSILFWTINFHLFCVGDPANSYASTDIARRILWPRQTHHDVKIGISSGGVIELAAVKHTKLKFYFIRLRNVGILTKYLGVMCDFHMAISSISNWYGV